MTDHGRHELLVGELRQLSFADRRRRPVATTTAARHLVLFHGRLIRSDIGRDQLNLIHDDLLNGLVGPDQKQQTYDAHVDQNGGCAGSFSLSSESPQISRTGTGLDVNCSGGSSRE